MNYYCNLIIFLSDENYLEVEDSKVGMTQCSSSSEFCEPPLKKRRRTFINKNIEYNKMCSSKRTEQIHQALAKMIAINQMPISFCSSSGFQQFMAIVEPNYVICKEGAIKRRLKAFKSSIEEKIKNVTTNCPLIHTVAARHEPL